MGTSTSINSFGSNLTKNTQFGAGSNLTVNTEVGKHLEEATMSGFSSRAGTVIDYD